MNDIHATTLHPTKSNADDMPEHPLDTTDEYAFTAQELPIGHHGRRIGATAYLPRRAKFSIVIFSHGFNGYRHDFRDTAELLARRGIGSITFTFCGSGARDQSGMPTTEMTLFTECEDLLAVIDVARRLPHFNGTLVLFGASQGGMVSAMAAQRRQQELAGLVLMFPAFCIPDDWNARYPTEESIPDEVELWGVTLGSPFIRTLRTLDIYRDMPLQRIPVLLFHGTDDSVVPLSYSRRAAQAYPDARLIAFPKEGHGFSPAAMRLVQTQLMDFIMHL